ncbi:SDR family NAD(P)-dependent oxidoreductase [Pseudonocardia halophobica]|uniref:SDR family NAD(P)-dependent oxidoreductase n=1 Tax=Pseudonocardia halophobica TaxID=29401 RepID=UPI003D8CA5C8
MASPLVAGKIVLVTGGGSGIGAATARLCAEEAAKAVYVADRDGETATATSNQINSDVGAKIAVAVALDVVHGAEVDALVDRIVAEQGRLDCAVNAAGTSGPRKRIEEYTDEEWRHVIAINLDGLFFCLRAETRAMRDGGSGSIVNIASGAHVEPPPRLAPYAATKSAVVTMTKAVAGEYGRAGVRINSVLPGKTRTKMLERNFTDEKLDEIAATLPMGRIGAPSELAEAIVWLLSDRSSYVNGAELLVDGGSHAASRINESALGSS